MALKEKSRFSSHNVLFRLSNALRTIGWFAMMITLGASIPRFFERYQIFGSYYSTFSLDAVRYAVMDTAALWTAGLGFAACAFILSVMLYTGLTMLAHKRTQMELLQRLARERTEKLQSVNAIILIETL
jgi:hypothetical protein